MYIVYNEENKEYRLYFDVNDNVEEFINKYKKHNKLIWKLSDHNEYYKSKNKSYIIKYCRRFFNEGTIIKNKKEIKEYKNKEAEYNKKKYKKNKNKILEKEKIYRKKNRNKIRNRRKIDRRTNPAKHMFMKAKKRAKQKNLEFSITEKDVRIALEKTKNINGEYICPALSIKLNANSIICHNSLTIDRVDNKKGYTVDNICIVSYKFNALKKDITLDFIHKLEKYLNSENFVYSELYNIDEVFKKAKLHILRYNAIRRLKYNEKQNIYFNLKPKDVKIPKIDFFGNPISLVKNCSHEQKPSCDRVDPNKGYIKDNIRWISMKSNRIKGDITNKTLKIIKDYIEKFGKNNNTQLSFPFQ